MTHACPDCGSEAYKRNGYTRHGKQNHRCLECGRQFSFEVQELIKKDDLTSFSKFDDEKKIKKGFAQIIID